MDQLPNLGAREGAAALNVGGAGLSLAGGAIAREEARRRAKGLREAGEVNRRRTERAGRRGLARFEASRGARNITERGSFTEVVRDSRAEIERAAMEELLRGEAAADAEEAEGTAALLSSIVSAASLLARPALREAVPRRRRSNDPTLRAGTDFRPGEPGQPF